MPTPEQERMDALTEAILRLRRRQDELEDRIRELERERGIAPPPSVQIEKEEPPPSPPPEVSVPTSIPVPQPPPLPMEPLPVPEPAAVHSSAAPPAAEVQPLETRMGLTWVNRIGVVTLLFGAAFFFKYAVDNQWIGETGRVILGIAAGLAALFGGDRLWNSGQRVFGQGLTGLGIGLLYFAFYASFGFYKIVPQPVAFALMIVTTASAGVFAIRYNSLAIAILGMAGGYSTPALLSTGVDAPWVLFSYVFLLNLAALAVGRRQRWRSLEILALVATFIYYAGWLAASFKEHKRVVATVWAFAYYAQFAISALWPVFAITQFLVSFAIAAIFEDQTAGFFISALLIAAGGLAHAWLRNTAESAPAAFSAFWIAFWFWRENSSFGSLVAVFVFLTAAFAMFQAYVVWRGRQARTSDLIVLALNGAVYYGASYVLLQAEYKDYMGLLAVGVAAAYLGVGRYLWAISAPEGEGPRDPKPALLAAGMAISFLTLAAPIQFTSYRITIAWAVEAAALVWLGLRAGEEKLRFAAMAVYILVFVRLFAIDAWAPTGNLIGNARFLTFGIAAISYWLAAYWIRRGLSAGIIYSTGHLVLLWSLGMETLDWSARSTAADNLRSVEMVSLSILMAMYGLMLVTIGVSTRTVLNRMLGLGLLGLVVIKLYLIDVWELRRIYRMIAFIALGGLLLVTSYLYSRFRATIEKWWKDDQAPS